MLNHFIGFGLDRCLVTSRTLHPKHELLTKVVYVVTLLDWTSVFEWYMARFIGEVQDMG